MLPATSAPATSSAIFPPLASSDIGGFLYLNLDDRNATRPSRNWIVTSMFAEGRYAVDFDATPLGNGCTPAAPPSSQAPIGPMP